MLSEKARSQQQALWELVETEVAYIRTLKVIQDVRSSSKLLFSFNDIFSPYSFALQSNFFFSFNFQIWDFLDPKKYFQKLTTLLFRFSSHVCSTVFILSYLSTPISKICMRRHTHIHNIFYVNFSSFWTASAIYKITWCWRKSTRSVCFVTFPKFMPRIAFSGTITSCQCWQFREKPGNLLIRFWWEKAS